MDEPRKPSVCGPSAKNAGEAIRLMSDMGEADSDSINAELSRGGFARKTARIRPNRAGVA